MTVRPSRKWITLVKLFWRYAGEPRGLVMDRSAWGPRSKCFAETWYNGCSPLVLLYLIRKENYSVERPKMAVLFCNLLRLPLYIWQTAAREKKKLAYTKRPELDSILPQDRSFCVELIYQHWLWYCLHSNITTEAARLGLRLKIMTTSFYATIRVFCLAKKKWPKMIRRPLSYTQVPGSCDIRGSRNWVHF